MCSAGPFNLSHKSLSSPAIRQELNKIAQTPFYADITSGRSQNSPQASTGPDGQFEEDSIPADDDNYDDTSTSTRRIKKRTLRTAKKAGKARRKGRAAVPKPSVEELEPPAQAQEDDDAYVPGFDDYAMINGAVQLAVPVVLKRSTRVRTKARRFDNPEWLDNDVSTSEGEDSEGAGSD